MGEELEAKKLELDKQSKKILLFLFLSLLFKIGISYVGPDNILFLFDVMLTTMSVPLVERELCLGCSNILMMYLPSVVTIMCYIKMNKLSKEKRKINDEYIEYSCKKIFEENKYRVDVLLEEGKKLSRSELMCFLNKTKTELVKAEENNKFKCKDANILMLNYLQDGLEDILFPSVTIEEEAYTRKRKK